MICTVYVRDSKTGTPVAHAEYRHKTHGDVFVGLVSGKQELKDCIEYGHVEHAKSMDWLTERGYERLHREVP